MLMIPARWVAAACLSAALPRREERDGASSKPPTKRRDGGAQIKAAGERAKKEKRYLTPGRRHFLTPLIVVRVVYTEVKKVLYVLQRAENTTPTSFAFSSFSFHAGIII